MPTASKRRRLSPIDRMTPEELYLQHNGERPEGFGLHNAKSKDGIEARAGLYYLMAQIKAPGNYAAAARNILRSSARPLENPLDWNDLLTLSHDYWLATLPLLQYVWRTKCLRCDDFDDDGEEFARLVFPEHSEVRATAEASA